MTENVLILGGVGLVGRHLVALIVDQKLAARVSSTPTRDSPSPCRASCP